jgi:hypothetical protein
LGEKAVIEWLFHIAIDNLATAFKMSSKSFSYGSKTYNLMEFGFGRSGYIHCEFDRVEERDLHFISGRRNRRRLLLGPYTKVRCAIAEMLGR